MPSVRSSIHAVERRAWGEGTMEQRKRGIVTNTGNSDRPQQRIKQQAQLIAQPENEVLRQRARAHEAVTALNETPAELANLRLQSKR